MMRQFSSRALCAVLLFMTAAFSVEAQEANVGSTPTQSKTQITIPTGSLGSVDGNQMEVNFTLRNDGDVVESNITYGVLLGKVEEGTDGELISTADEVYSNDVITLKPGEIVEKTMQYTNPPSLRGTYRIGVIAAKTSGADLALAYLDTVELVDDPNSIYIDDKTCRIAIEGENQAYATKMGIDIAVNETAFLECDATNGSENILAFVPEFTVYERSIATQPIATELYAMEEMVPGETRTIRFPLPTPQKPQAYQMVLRLLDDGSREPLSNYHKIQLVVQGPSGTIQNVSLDKSSYAKGDLATVTLVTSPRADFFPNARSTEYASLGADDIGQRYVAHVKIQGADGLCSEEKIVSLYTKGYTGTTDVQIPVTGACTNPTVIARLDDGQGEIFDEGSFTATGANEGISVGGEVKQMTDKIVKSETKPVVLAVVAISIILAIIVILVGRKKGMRALLFGLMASATMLMSAQTAEAGTTQANYGTGGNEGIYATHNVSQNGCQQPVVSGQLKIWGCGNPANGGDGGEGSCGLLKIDGSKLRDIDCNNGTHTGCSREYSYSKTLPSGAQGSSSDVRIDVEYFSHCRTDSASTAKAPGWEGFTYNTCAPSPRCGSANNTTRTSVPSSTQACNPGTITDISQSSTRYTWNCENSSGSVSCSANKPTPVNGQCGSSHTRTTSSHPNGSSACARGGYSEESDSSSRYQWSCNGSNGGSQTSCYSNKQQTNGSCGSSDGGTFSSEPYSNLCSSGSLTTKRTTSGGWTWSCNGSNGGGNDSCSASRPSSVVGSCGTADGGTLSSKPSGGVLCASGDATTVGTSGTQYTWNCNGTNGGGNDSCSAGISAPVGVINGTCGTANTNGNLTTQPSTQAELCAAGTPTGVTGNGSPWNWSCMSSNGGSNAACSASLKTVAACGTADGGSYLFAEPTDSELCAPGLTPVKDFSSSTENWLWKCQNTVGEESLQCAATKNCATDQYACSNKCATLSLQGNDIENFARDGGAVTTGQTVIATDTSCIESCELDGQTVPLASINTSEYELSVSHSPAGSDAKVVTCKLKTPSSVNCPAGSTDPDCTKDEVTEKKQIQCVCTARKCSASGQCVASPVFGASSGSDASCSSDCNTNADCGGGSLQEVSP